MTARTAWRRRRSRWARSGSRPAAGRTDDKTPASRAGGRHGLADRLQDSARQLDQVPGGFPQRPRRGLLRLHLLGAGRPDRRHDHGPDRRPAAPAAGPDRAARLAAAPLLAAGRPGRGLAAPDHQSRLLAGDAGDAGPGRLGYRHVHGDRHPARNHGGPSAQVLYLPAADPRPDANHPDLRLPDPDPDPVRSGCRPRPDLDRDLRPAGADPADLSRGEPGAACP